MSTRRGRAKKSLIVGHKNLKNNTHSFVVGFFVPSLSCGKGAWLQFKKLKDKKERKWYVLPRTALLLRTEMSILSEDKMRPLSREAIVTKLAVAQSTTRY